VTDIHSFDQDTGEIDARQQGMVIMSPSFGKIAGALAKAQGAFVSPKKDRTVTVKTRDNREYKFSYATLDAIMGSVRAPLAENAIAIVQLVVPTPDGKYVLRTMILHESGEYIGTETPLLVAERSNQAFGSALTYMRRYTLSALLGVVADEDDDANTADGNTATPATPRQPVQRPVAQKPASAAPRPAAAQQAPVESENPAPSPERDVRPEAPPQEVKFTSPPPIAAPQPPPAPPRPAPAPAAGPAPTAKQIADKALNDFNTIKAEIAMADTKQKLETVILARDARLAEIADVSANAAKAVDGVRAEINAKMAKLQ